MPLDRQRRFKVMVRDNRKSKKRETEMVAGRERGGKNLGV